MLATPQAPTKIIVTVSNVSAKRKLDAQAGGLFAIEKDYFYEIGEYEQQECPPSCRQILK